MHAIAHGVVWGPSIFREPPLARLGQAPMGGCAVGMFRAVAIGSGETAMFVVVDDRMVTFGTVVHRRTVRTGCDVNVSPT